MTGFKDQPQRAPFVDAIAGRPATRDAGVGRAQARTAALCLGVRRSFRSCVEIHPKSSASLDLSGVLRAVNVIAKAEGRKVWLSAHAPMKAMPCCAQATSNPIKLRDRRLRARPRCGSAPLRHCGERDRADAARTKRKRDHSDGAIARA